MKLPLIENRHIDRLLRKAALTPSPFLRFLPPAPPRPWYQRVWRWLVVRGGRLVLGGWVAFTNYDVHEDCE